jgi:hypothetical protein
MSCTLLTMRYSHFLIHESLPAIITFLPKKLNCIMFVIKINNCHQLEGWQSYLSLASPGICENVDNIEIY